ncbi:MAG: DUF2024 family protein [Burkholderiaceae bacterium]|nr:DUF2024 family protein [Burkholderiaceae bacterium]MDH3459890.1 DUF2024 family protein [Burkholderiaceae bacterium]
MQIAVFDTYVRRPDGRRMHFDILVPNTNRDQATVTAFGRAYLASKNIPADTLVSEECRFCHFESASAEVEQDILRAGYSILEMQNCD